MYPHRRYSGDGKPIVTNASQENDNSYITAKIDEYMNARTAIHQFSGSILVVQDGEIVIS